MLPPKTLLNRPDICDAYRYSIRYICKERKITLTHIASKVGISRVMLSYFLIGQKIISSDTMERIATALDFETVEDLAVFPYLNECLKEREKSVRKNYKNKK